jgi:hypothetical protein
MCALIFCHSENNQFKPDFVRATSGSVGLDLPVQAPVVISPGATVVADLGVRFAFPDNVCGILRLRSGASNLGIDVTAGVIGEFSSSLFCSGSDLLSLFQTMTTAAPSRPASSTTAGPTSRSRRERPTCSSCR